MVDVERNELISFFNALEAKHVTADAVAHIARESEIVWAGEDTVHGVCAITESPIDITTTKIGGHESSSLDCCISSRRSSNRNDWEVLNHREHNQAWLKVTDTPNFRRGSLNKLKPQHPRIC